MIYLNFLFNTASLFAYYTKASIFTIFEVRQNAHDREKYYFHVSTYGPLLEIDFTGLMRLLD